jgi:hypothetical protein
MRRPTLATLILLWPAAAHADPFSFFAAVAAFAGTVGTITAVQAFVATVAISVFGAAHARRKARKKEAEARAAFNASLEDRNVTALTAVPPQRVVYGRPGQFGGDVVAIFTSDKTGTREDGSSYTKPDALKHIVVHIASHQCQAVHEVYIDGLPIGVATLADGWSTVEPFASSRPEPRLTNFTGAMTSPESIAAVLNVYHTSTNNGENVYTTATYSLSGNTITLTGASAGLAATADFTVSTAKSVVRWSVHLGTDDQTVDSYLNSVKPTEWTAEHRLRGLCYGVLTLDLEDARFQGGPPGITFDVSGKLLFDPRTSTTAFSRNPALVVNDWLQAPWGFDCSATEVDTAYVNAAANACDVLETFTTNDPNDGIRSDFAGTTDGWAAAGATLTQGADSVTIDSTGVDPQFVGPAISVPGATHNRIRARVKRISGSGWDGRAFYTTSGHSFTSSFHKQIADTTVIGQWVELEWNMSSLTVGDSSDYSGNTITRIRIDLGASSSDDFEIDWVSLQKRLPVYQCDGVFTTDQPKESVLESLCDSMAGFAVCSAKWQVHAGAWTPPVADLGPADLHGQIEVVQVGASFESAFNGVRGTFVPAGKSVPVDIDPYQNATFVAADGAELWTDVDFPFTSDKTRCKNLARIFTERARSSLVVRFHGKLHLWPLQVGDRVRVTNAEYGFNLKTFRITDWQYGLTSPVVLTLQEDTETIYDLADAATRDPTPNSDLRDPFTVAAVAMPTPPASGTSHLVKGLDGTITPRVFVTWTAVADPYVLESPGKIELLWRGAGASAWSKQDLPGDATKAYIAGVREGDRLVIELRAVNSLGQRGPSTFANHTVVGKTQRPANVSGLVQAITGSGVQLTWAQNTELDYDNTELRVGASWNAGTRLFKGAATTWTWPFPAQGSYTVWAKHFDTTGNESLNEVPVAVTVDSSATVQWGTLAGRPKLFRVVSKGLSDTASPSGPQLFNGETGGVLQPLVNRSYMMSRIRRSDGVVTFSRQYDVFAVGASGGFTAATLAADLNATGSDHLVVVFTDDEPKTNRLTSGLEAAMYRCGASRAVFGSPEFKARSAYVLVGIGGCGEGNGYEAYQGDVDNSSNAWCDVAFSLLNGNYTTGGTSATPRTLKDYSYVGDLAATRDVTLVATSNVSLAGNSATKTGTDGWDGEVRSQESFVSGAFAAFSPGNAPINAMVGLNSDPTTNASYETIDYAIYVRGDGVWDVRQSGSVLGTFDAYAAGDAFVVTYDGASVRFHRNGVVYHTAAAGAGLKFFLDSSIHTQGGQLKNLRFGPMSPVTNIGTGQLQNNAATVPVTAFTAGLAAENDLGSTGEIVLQTLTASFTGAAVQVKGSADIGVEVSGGGGSATFDLRLYEDGVLIYDGPSTVQAPSSGVTTVYWSTPAMQRAPLAGNHTYQLRSNITAFTGSAFPRLVQYHNTSIQVLELKR